MAEPKNLNYRESETRYALTKLNAGDSCALVGVGSVGKSNLLRHLQNPDVQRYYLSTDAENLHIIFIDPNNMLDPLPAAPGTTHSKSWAGYEIMTHRLFRHFQPLFHTMPPEDVEELFEVYKRLQGEPSEDGSNPLATHIALRYLEHSVNLMIRQEMRLVFMFDEFDEMLRELPPKFFRTLRGLRDDNKYKLMYLTVTRKALLDLVAEEKHDYDSLEPFTELFTDNTRYVGSYTLRDASDMMQNLMERNNVHYPSTIQDMIVKISGGHAGLMRSSFSVANFLDEGLDEDEASERLIRYRALQTENHTIWLSLNEREKQILQLLVSNRRETIDARDPRAVDVRTLIEKQLVQKRGDWLTPSPPLFRAYLRVQFGGA